MPTAMIALGGNSISQKGEAGDISLQFAHTRQALDGISHFIIETIICVLIMVMVHKLEMNYTEWN